MDESTHPPSMIRVNQHEALDVKIFSEYTNILEKLDCQTCLLERALPNEKFAIRAVKMRVKIT